MCMHLEFHTCVCDALCVNASACLMRAITQWASDTPEFNSILKPPVSSHCCREDIISVHTHQSHIHIHTTEDAWPYTQATEEGEFIPNILHATTYYSVTQLYLQQLSENTAMFILPVSTKI